MSDAQLYQQLSDHVRVNAYLQSSMSTLEWDQQTYLPAQAAGWRAEQLTFLAGELHRRETAPEMGEWLSDLEEKAMSDAPASDMAINVREMKKDFEKKNKIPVSLVEAMTKACSLAQQTWVEARKTNDFAMFAPPLKEIFDLKVEYADAVGYESERYDALLDDFEPGARTSEVRQVLNDLREELVPLIQAVADAPQSPNTEWVKRHYPVEQQEAFGKLAAKKIGFDFARGRLDVTAHPFCDRMGPNDVRLTTRYDANFFNSAFFGILHEAGHGIYEQGLRGDQFGFPTGSYCSLGIHESQSRLWENLVGRSLAFWEYMFPVAKDHFPQALEAASHRDFFAAVNAVKPSLIRVEADEATYNLHIIIRFELEQEILNGETRVEDLAEAWNEKYEKYLGIRPDSPADGVLQDIHWSAGLMGYFPTYSLGNLYASQFFEAAQKDLGNLNEQICRGEFSALKSWLNENVHLPGRSMTAPELAQKVTGKPLGHSELITHLKDKLSEVYGI